MRRSTGRTAPLRGHAQREDEWARHGRVKEVGGGRALTAGTRGNQAGKERQPRLAKKENLG